MCLVNNKETEPDIKVKMLVSTTFVTILGAVYPI